MSRTEVYRGCTESCWGHKESCPSSSKLFTTDLVLFGHKNLGTRPPDGERGEKRNQDALTDRASRPATTTSPLQQIIYCRLVLCVSGWLVGRGHHPGPESAHCSRVGYRVEYWEGAPKPKHQTTAEGDITLKQIHSVADHSRSLWSSKSIEGRATIQSVVEMAASSCWIYRTSKFAKAVPSFRSCSRASKNTMAWPRRPPMKAPPRDLPMDTLPSAL